MWHPDSAHVGLMVAAIGKLFIMAARSQPPISENAGYVAKWAHNFLQLAADNDDKVKHPNDSEKERPVTPFPIPIAPPAA